jgi:hypothetical protein
MTSPTVDASSMHMTALGQTRQPWRSLHGAEPGLLGKHVKPGADLLLAGAALVVIVGIAHALTGIGFQRMWVLLMMAPLAEEAIFRSGVQESLLRKGVPNHAANALTAVLFGLAHIVLQGDHSARGVVLPALLVGALYWRTRRLLPCVLLHAAMNAVWVAWRLLGPATPAFR